MAARREARYRERQFKNDPMLIALKRAHGFKESKPPPGIPVACGIGGDGTNCPNLPMPFHAAPGSAYGGHHSFAGGLVLHEMFNSISSMKLASYYRPVYGTSSFDGIPIPSVPDNTSESAGADIFISQDLVVAAPIWHDWAKPIVFQWNANGSEFTEWSFGGKGSSDAWGQPGDSRTGGITSLPLPR